jgi:hypothetical protein
MAPFAAKRERRLMQTSNDIITRGTAIVGLLGIAVIHAVQVPDGFDDMWYIGILFTAATVASLVLAAAITQTSDARVIELAGGLAALIMIAFVLSRTSGLPSYTDYKGVWDDAQGMASLALEGLLVCVTGASLALRAQTSSRSSSIGPRATAAPGMS